MSDLDDPEVQRLLEATKFLDNVCRILDHDWKVESGIRSYLIPRMRSCNRCYHSEEIPLTRTQAKMESLGRMYGSGPKTFPK